MKRIPKIYAIKRHGRCFSVIYIRIHNFSWHFCDEGCVIFHLYFALFSLSQTQF